MGRGRAEWRDELCADVDAVLWLGEGVMDSRQEPGEKGRIAGAGGGLGVTAREDGRRKLREPGLRDTQ